MAETWYGPWLTYKKKINKSPKWQQFVDYIWINSAEVKDKSSMSLRLSVLPWSNERPQTLICWVEWSEKFRKAQQLAYMRLICHFLTFYKLVDISLSVSFQSSMTLHGTKRSQLNARAGELIKSVWLHTDSTVMLWVCISTGVACPTLAALPNGNLLPSSCVSTGGKYTDRCTYYCSSGYSLLGTGSRQCQADGTWDGSAPTCKKSNVKTFPFAFTYVV